MVELNVIIYGIVLIFIFIVIVAIGVTVLQVIMPITNAVANETDFINATEFEADQNQIWNFAKIALLICIAIPFVYIAIKLLYKEEPTAYIGDY